MNFVQKSTLGVHVRRIECFLRSIWYLLKWYNFHIAETYGLSLLAVNTDYARVRNLGTMAQLS